MPMPLTPGSTSTGFFLVILSLPRKPGGCWICMLATGKGHHLAPQDHIISADEKTSIQARLRCSPSLPPAPGRAQRIEYEYARGGALQYLAAWDYHGPV